MRSRIEWLVIAAVALGACTVERGKQPGAEGNVQPGGTEIGFRAWPDSAPPSSRQVFDRERQTVAAGVTRLIVHAIIGVDKGRAAARAAMQAIADSARHRDTTLAAVRVIGYFPPTMTDSSAQGATLTPLGYLEWVPLPGWDSLTVQTAHVFHRVNIVWLRPVPEAPAPVTP
jgi:hypothetical protein